MTEELRIVNVTDLRKAAENINQNLVSKSSNFSIHEIIFGNNNTIIIFVIKTNDIYAIEAFAQLQSDTSTPNSNLDVKHYFFEFLPTIESPPSIAISDPNFESGFTGRWIAHSSNEPGIMHIINIDTMQQNAINIIDIFWESGKRDIQKSFVVQNILCIQQLQGRVFVYTISRLNKKITNLATKQSAKFESSLLLLIVEMNIESKKISINHFNVLGSTVHQYHLYPQNLGTRFAVRKSEDETWMTLNVVPYWPGQAPNHDPKKGFNNPTTQFRIWREYGSYPWHVPVSGMPRAGATIISIDQTRNDIQIYYDHNEIAVIHEDCLQGFHLRWIDIDTKRGEIVLYKKCTNEDSHRGVMTVMKLGQGPDVAYLVSSACNFPPSGVEHCTVLSSRREIILRNPPAWLHAYSTEYKYCNTRLRLFVKMNRIGRHPILKAFERAFFCQEQTRNNALPNIQNISKSEELMILKLEAIIRSEIGIPLSPDFDSDVESALEYEQIFGNLSEVKRNIREIIEVSFKPYLNMRHLLSVYTDDTKDCVVSKNLDYECFAHLPSAVDWAQVAIYENESLIGHKQVEKILFNQQITSAIDEVILIPSSLIELAKLDLFAQDIIENIQEFSKPNQFFDFNTLFTKKTVIYLFPNNTVYNDLKKAVVGFYQKFMAAPSSFSETSATNAQEESDTIVSKTNGNESNSIIPMTDDNIKTQKDLVQKIMNELFKQKDFDSNKSSLIPIVIMDYFLKITGIPETAFQLPKRQMTHDFLTEYAISQALMDQNRNEVPENMLALFNCLRAKNQLHELSPKDYQTILHGDFNALFTQYRIEKYLELTKRYHFIHGNAMFCFLLLEKLKTIVKPTTSNKARLKLTIDEIPENITELYCYLLKNVYQRNQRNEPIIEFWTIDPPKTPLEKETEQLLQQQKFYIYNDLFEFGNWLWDIDVNNFALVAAKILLVFRHKENNSQKVSELPQKIKALTQVKSAIQFKHNNRNELLYFMMFSVAYNTLKKMLKTNGINDQILNYFKATLLDKNLYKFAQLYIVYNEEFETHHKFLLKTIFDTNIPIKRRALIILLETIKKTQQKLKTEDIQNTRGFIANLHIKSIEQLLTFLPAWDLDYYVFTENVASKIKESYGALIQHANVLNKTNGIISYDVTNIEFWDELFSKRAKDPKA